MARLKLLTNGSKLWTRTIGSTIVGQAVDTVLVITLTFGGVYSGPDPAQHDCHRLPAQGRL